MAGKPRCGSSARSDQVESPGRKELAQDQWLEHDLIAKVVSTFADHALTRSSLHRCLQRHGIGRLPDAGGEKAAKKKFKVYPIGFFHIDIAEVQTAGGRLYLLVAIDRTSKFAFVELHSKAARRVAADFLRNLADAVPYKINTILTDSGTHVTDPGGGGWSVSDIKAMRAEGVLFRCHSFDAACADLDIEHRLTKPMHPWTNGQVERMNRTIKEAT